ncbi:MAG: response regulator [Planctomycetes bacterium]|nr:response regulator [Planctomycetota bacterium]
MFVVEDDWRQRQEIADYLRYKGFSVVEFASGSAALNEVSNCKPQVVLMDIRMPGRDGIQAAKAMISSSPSTKVILMTGVSKEIEHARAACDVFAVIGKPFSANQLFHFVSGAFGEYQRTTADSNRQRLWYEVHNGG